MRYLFGIFAVMIGFLSLPAMADDLDDTLANYSQYRRAVPTVYYIPFYNLDKNYQCGKESRVWLYDLSKKAIANVCTSHFQNCRMQGSCVLIKQGRPIMINYRRNYYFTIVDQTSCPYGFGPRNVCLEPYYSVAADPAFHKQGDVLYMHELRGVKLPNGETHNGFMVVRDTGGHIKGRDRFDLYTGFSAPNDPYNPFIKLNFNDKKTLLRYTKIVNPEIKAKVLKKRKFPSIASEF